MSLKNYFAELINKVESSSEISNAGKDANGFFKPQKTILLRHLQLLYDLHDKPRAKQMVLQSWVAISEQLPMEWLVLQEPEKSELKKILSSED